MYVKNIGGIAEEERRHVMYKSKKYSYDYDEIDETEKSCDTMVADILADPEFADLEEVVIGCWGEPWDENEGAEIIIQNIIENKEKFTHIKSLFVGDMDFEECEVSWIVQGNYEKLLEAMPQLEKLTIKGSTDLGLGKLNAPNLRSLEIICGGLPKEVMESIRDANLPELEELRLYIGVEDYGFDGSLEDIKALLEKSNFPKLKILGLCDSEIQDEICELVLASKYIKQLQRLELSMGSLTDKGGQLLLDQLPQFPNVKYLDVHYHYMTDEMMKKLKAMSIEVDMEEQNEPDEWDGDLYYYPMLTE